MSSIDKDIDKDKKTHKSTLMKISVGLVATIAIIAALYVIIPTVIDTPDSQSGAKTDNDTVAEQSLTAEAPAMSESERKALQEGLSQANQRLSAMSLDKQNWQPTRRDKVNAELEEAYAQYGRGNYQQASEALSVFNASLDNYHEDFERAYLNAYEDALTAYNNGKVHTAQAAIDTALNIKPDFEKAQALRKRIAVYEEVQYLYEEARVGGVENNLQKQYQALSRIVSLDPEQESAQQQLADVSKTLSASTFNEFVSQAITAVDKKEYDRASALLSQAAAIKPNSTQVVTLQSRIEREQRTQGLASIEKQVKIFAQADQWQTVSMLADKGLQTYPASQVLQIAATNSQKLLAADKTLTQYLSRPDRLADDRIRQNAEQALSNAQSIAQLSPKLQRTITEFKNVLSQYNAPLPVTVHSDGKTLIKVLGVGVVGEVAKKQITLKPGAYRFEGSRQGYRSKIISVEVSASSAPVTVRLICDEKV